MHYKHLKKYNLVVSPGFNEQVFLEILKLYPACKLKARIVLHKPLLNVSVNQKLIDTLYIIKLLEMYKKLIYT